MAMSLGGGTQRIELNVTPLIDVLLVLLIIFMVLTPSLSEGLGARVPQQEKQKTSSPGDDVVVTVLGNGMVRLNQQPLALEELGHRLKALLSRTNSHVIFVRAENNLEFEQIADVIDIAKGVGFDHIALMTQ